jgi:hypothetical protein
MKFLTKYTALFTILFSLITLNSCKDDCPPCDDPTNPECENYDPCFGKDTINTLFKVRPGDNGFKPPEEWCDLVACDTFNASSVRFDAPDGNPENSTYTWQIGSEAEPRTGRGFEVDFSDYLRDNGWEQWIDITLTIKTPMNECLKGEEESVKTVTRQLYFTEERRPNWYLGDFTLKGKINNIPAKIEFVFNDKVSFRGVAPPHYLIIGLPNYDTILYPQCRAEYCNNYRHSIIQFNHPTCEENIDFNLISDEIIAAPGSDEITRTWIFNDSSLPNVYVFKGKKM